MTRGFGVKLLKATRGGGLASVVRSWAAYALAPAVGLATAPILARALGPEGRGELAGVLQPMTIASAVALFGIPAAVTYFIGRGFCHRSVRRVAHVLGLASMLVVASALVAYSGAVSRNLDLDRLTILAVWLGFVPSVAIAIRRGELQAWARFGTLDLERASGAVARLFLILLLAGLGVGTMFPYAAGYMIAGLLVSLLLFRGVRQKSTACLPELEPMRMFRFASLASMSSMALVMNNRLDQAIMPAVSNSVDIGYYSAAVAVAEAPLVISVVVARNLLSEVSRRGVAGRASRTFWFGLGAISAAVVAGQTVLSWVFPFLFGSDFAPAVVVCRLLLCAVVLQFCSEAAIAVLNGLGRPGLSSVGPVLAVTVTVVGFLWVGSGIGVIQVTLIAIASQVVSATVGVGIVLSLKIVQDRKGSVL